MRIDLYCSIQVLLSSLDKKEDFIPLMDDETNQLFFKH